MYHFISFMPLYFFHAILCPENTIPPKTISIGDFAIVDKGGLFWLSIVICDITRTWHTAIVTSYSLIVLERINCRKGDHHKWITTVNINFSATGIHGLACKEVSSYIAPLMCDLAAYHYKWLSRIRVPIINLSTTWSNDDLSYIGPIENVGCKMWAILLYFPIQKTCYSLHKKNQLRLCQVSMS